ncbi:hypothetical protein FOTG_18294 [Fusarium oxysporum f. sp. vasinfectum 25433]|uniref:Secondary metabolism regulator laeA n=1 Tax=Fusarium oxysporum f. sp. vasinfectum 25433 TaxID=1089449 RepID=X0KIB6_FUSOX|nr:hypothetical protein FOTG_18294 [Fusarium oxysporum f. sp. vasinfectum 25433]
MDLGTGTGIWPVSLAEEYLFDAQIMAIDLNQVQPTLIPRGVTSKQFDIEEPIWTSLLTDCNLVHMRMLLGSIETHLWPQIYGNIFEHLAPGDGYIEHVEIDWTPRWQGYGQPENSSFQRWSELFLSSMDKFNRSARVVPAKTEQLIKAAGFTDVKQEVIKAFVCPWTSDSREQEVARWFNLALSRSLEALSMMPLIEKQGLKLEEVRELCARARKEICALQNHAFCNIHVWTARKPEGSLSIAHIGQTETVDHTFDAEIN